MSHAQSVDIITDRNIYAAGENIWFSAQIQSEAKSAVLYIDVSNGRGERFAQGKFKIDETTSIGTLKIPSNLRTGAYFMRAYTRELLSSSPFLITATEILIVNHQSSPLTKMKSCASVSAIDPIPIEIQSKKEIERIEIQSNAIDPGYYSVSVIPHNTFNAAKQNLKLSCDFAEAESFGFAEKRSTTLKGKLVNPKDKTPIANALIVGSTIGKQAELHLVRTDDLGRFILTFRSISPSEVVYLVAPEITETGTKFLVDHEFPELKPKCEAVGLILSDSLVSLLSKVSFNAKVMARYGEETPAIISRGSIPEPFTSPTEEIILADYIVLGSMNEVFTELVPYSGVKTKNKKQIITLYDHQYHKPLENPLVLLDNVPFIDHDAILRIAPSKIRSISVVANPYYYGDETINGVISIHSKNGRLGGLELPKNVELIDFSGFQESVTWNEPKSHEAGQANLSNTAFWNPRLKVGLAGLNISFDKGQRIGDFDVIITSLSPESNEIHTATVRLDP